MRLHSGGRPRMAYSAGCDERTLGDVSAGACFYRVLGARLLSTRKKTASAHSISKVFFSSELLVCRYVASGTRRCRHPVISKTVDVHTVVRTSSRRSRKRQSKAPASLRPGMRIQSTEITYFSSHHHQKRKGCPPPPLVLRQDRTGETLRKKERKRKRAHDPQIPTLWQKRCRDQA